MAAPTSPSRSKGATAVPGMSDERLARAGTRIARILRRAARLLTVRLRSPAGAVAAAVLGLVVVCALAAAALSAARGAGEDADALGVLADARREADVEDPALLGPSARRLKERALRAARARNATGGVLGNRFCVMQPTLSAGKDAWTEEDARNHIALRAFMRTFTDTVTEEEKERVQFAIYYGHDSDDPVFGDAKLRAAFTDEARSVLREKGFSDAGVELVFTPLYGLHGRVNAIWNMMVKDAYYDGCDYFFMSNDDMVFFTKGWVTSAVQSLDGIGSPVGKKRPCRYLGTVRFKDEWASWATFTFHVSTRLHVEIFGGTYYPVPYNAAHNDYWIHFVYRRFEASKFRGEVKVRNRVDDVDYALAHQKDTKHVAPPRYQYDKKGDVKKYIRQGQARLRQWLDENRGTPNCLPPL